MFEGLVAMSRYTSGGGGSAGSSGSGRLRSSLKCCTHLVASVARFHLLLPLPVFCLFVVVFTDMVWFELLPHSCLVIL